MQFLWHVLNSHLKKSRVEEMFQGTSATLRLTDLVLLDFSGREQMLRHPCSL